MPKMENSSADTIRIPNPVRRTATIWWAMCPVVLSGVFAPFLLDAFGIETGDWVFALMFFCLIFGITSIVVAAIYTRRARLLGRMLNKENLLAHWRYSPEEWAAYTEKEHRENRREKKNLFIMIAVISVVVGMILSIVHPDGWLIFLITVIGIILLMGFVAWLAVWLRHRQNLKNIGEVYLSHDAVYLNRELHVWRGLGAILEGVDYHGRPGSQGTIEILYSMPSRTGQIHVTARVPVPVGEEAAAKAIVSQLQSGS